ncbi:MAG: carboxypeptidase-like regulatory domain-containing protein [Acidimicrobiales bacterium]
MAFVAAACSGGEPAASPDPRAPVESTAPVETTAATTTTVAPATTVATTSTTVQPTTTLTTLLAMGPGEASIVGTVSGPAGGVEGAVVRVERLVGKDVASTEVVTSGGGSYAISTILGGSYRVRALKPPDYGSSSVEAFFLGATERKVVDIRVPLATGERIIATVNPNPPQVDQVATLAVQIGIGRANAEGEALITPRPGVLLAMASGPGLAVESSNQVITDANGKGFWHVRCLTVGADTLGLTVGAGVTQVKIPACVAGAPPPASPPTTQG